MMSFDENWALLPEILARGPWSYPWQVDEDPGFEDPELGLLRDRSDFLRGWEMMREKYDSKNKPHPPKWEPRFRDWRKQGRG